MTMTDGNRRPRVLVADAIADQGVAMLSEVFDVDVRLGMDEQTLATVIADYEAIIVRSATRLPANVIERAANLEVIARAGAGLDTIDVDAAVDAGIRVVNSPDANTIAVAELTMALILSLARNVPRADAALKAGRWEKDQLVGTGIAGKVLGIVGFGRIGRAVAQRATAFDMRVLTARRRSTPELRLQPGVTVVDRDELLEQADFVTIHVPASDETRGLVDADFLEHMKSSAWLVNTARGSVVDEAALLAALDEGRIAGAALDVFSDEPASQSVLARHPAVVATPHLGASTVDAQVAAATDVASQLISLLSSSQPRTILPLRVVEADRLVPHEAHDERRVADLMDRLAAESVLRNPPIVTAVDDSLVVLDGATRSEAVRRAGCQHMVVQIVEVEDALSLETWSHILGDTTFDEVCTAVAATTGLAIHACDRDEAIDLMLELGGVCAIGAADGRAVVVVADAGMHRFQAAAAVCRAYGETATVTRTLHRGIAVVQRDQPDMAALVVYPHWSVEQVLLAARSGQLLPAGVTRFVIPGRVLHLDVELAWLRADVPLADKNRQLHERLIQRQRAGDIRYYREPVYLLDD